MIMNDINKLFFELIQVAIGKRVCLSHSPAGEEWKLMYDMACEAIAGRRLLRRRAKTQLFFVR